MCYNYKKGGNCMLVALNAGHCLVTPGKQAPDGYKEYNFNMPVVKKIVAILKNHNVSSIICNPDSPTKEYTLTQITTVANKAKATVFVSVHFNAMGSNWNDVRGLETFYHKSGFNLAKQIHLYLAMGQPMPNRGIKQANYTVLVKTNMPAALVECGFMDNKIDRLLMESEEYRQECAEEISQGILGYLSIPYKPIPIVQTEQYLDILRQVSPWADSVWVPFINANPGINLKGLIVKLYEEGAKCTKIK